LGLEYIKNHAMMMFPLICHRRDALMLHLEKHSITTRTIMPLINQPYIKVPKDKYPTSKLILENGLLIGCHQDLSRKDLATMVKIIKDFYDKA